uniref:Uncharacterized protein n=1 Tax=Rhizophora mucronata TaxID=61149 RepID=A0A2P2N8R0_RHIMU
MINIKYKDNNLMEIKNYCLFCLVITHISL